MSDLENYTLSAVFFIVFCAIFFFWKKKKKNLGGRQKYILDALELAKSQFEIFNLKLPSETKAKNGFSAMLEDIGPKSLVMDVTGFMPEDCKGKPIEAFFRARSLDGPVFYAFNSIITDAAIDYGNSRITVNIPDHLRIEKKRHFIRVKPDSEDIRVIGVWPLIPGKRLPKSTSEMGTPVTHYKPGMTGNPVQVENISGSGIALRFSGVKEDKALQLAKGSQLLCLVVYVAQEGEKPTAFWCTGEIMNSRATDQPKPDLVVGLEFTNWAVLEQTSSEIHWAHSSPSRGARPMLQWVERIESKGASKSQA